MSNCDNKCSGCAKAGNCAKAKPAGFKLNDKSNIKNIIGVMSGKGGVGKSLVTSILASKLKKEGFRVGILDADITGPSIPHSFGIHEKMTSDETKLMYPCVSKEGIKVASVNLVIENETDPVLWRGPILGGAIKQFYEDVLWGELDYLLIDMPPGTSDVALTIYNNIPISGIIIVSTPQDLVSMIVGKALNMASKMNINVIGLVENMAYVKCDCCGNKIYPYGPSRLNEVAANYHILPLASLPIDPNIRALVDSGNIEDCETSDLDYAIEEIKNI